MAFPRFAWQAMLCVFFALRLSGVAYGQATLIGPQNQGQMLKGPMLQQSPPALPSLGPPPANVEITAFSVSPVPIRSGQPTTAKLTIRNAGTGTVARVPWAIHLYTGNQTLGQGEQANVAPGASFDVTANWIPAPGNQILQGYVDPQGVALRNTAPVGAHIRQLSVNVILSADAAIQQLFVPGNVRSLRITLQPDGNAAPPQWVRPASDPILQRLAVPGNVRSLRITLQPDAVPAPPQWSRPAADPILQQLVVPANVRSLRITLQPERR